MPGAGFVIQNIRVSPSSLQSCGQISRSSGGFFVGLVRKWFPASVSFCSQFFHSTHVRTESAIRPREILSEQVVFQGQGKAFLIVQPQRCRWFFCNRIHRCRLAHRRSKSADLATKRFGTASKLHSLEYQSRDLLIQPSITIKPNQTADSHDEIYSLPNHSSSFTLIGDFAYHVIAGSLRKCMFSRRDFIVDHQMFT